MSLLPAPPAQARVGEGEGVPYRSCTRTQGPWEREGPWGSWLTDEPDSLLPQGLLRALQVGLALAQVVLGPAPVPGQLERGEGRRAGAELPPSRAVLPPRATLLPPSRTFPAPHHVALGFGGSRGLPGHAGVPSSWQGPLWDPGGEDNLDQSLLQEGACSHGGTALRPPCRAQGRARPGRIVGALGLCLPGTRGSSMPAQSRPAAPASATSGTGQRCRGLPGRPGEQQRCHHHHQGHRTLCPPSWQGSEPVPARTGKMHQLGTDAATRFSTPGEDNGSHPLWLEAHRGFNVLALVAPGCCAAIAQSLGLQGPMPGAVWRELGGKGTDLPIHPGSRRRKAAVGREGGSAWS